MAQGTLYYGDNLDILRRYVSDESVDLVYLDPPFNSNASYNVLFAEQDGSRAAAQIQAFEDTWRWDAAAALAFQEVVEEGPQRVSQAMQGFQMVLGPSNMLAYLSMMAPRLVELRRALKQTGSIYLHCDPTASHYLKVLMDAVFGPDNLRTEVIWQRSTAKGHASTRYPSAHDSVLFYSRAAGYTWHTQYQPYRKEYLRSHYSHTDPASGRLYRLDNCMNPNPDRPHLTYEWHGHIRVWRWTREKMRTLEDEGRLVYAKSGLPQYKRYLDEMPGTPVTSVWTDIPPINSQAAERLGYPTQKPVALLERIVSASSNPGDVVLDPFAGCGTAVVAAQKLGRDWIGIDITHLSITLVRHRLRDTFGAEATFKVIGEPVSLPDAESLAQQDAFQFQLWALGLVGARPAEQKKGADRGVDGRIYFHDEPGKTKQIVISVKSGHVTASQVRDLRGVLEREKAQIALFVTLHEPTQPMRSEAAGAGFYESPGWHKSYPRLQILTIEELLGGRLPEYPLASMTFRRADRAQPGGGEQQALPL